MPPVTPPYGPSLGSPLSAEHHQMGFHPSMLLNAQLALQVQAAAMAAALGVSSAATPTSSIFSTSAASNGPGLGRGDSGTLHSMEKMVAGLNGSSAAE
jgi:hypothetical protein